MPCGCTPVIGGAITCTLTVKTNRRRVRKVWACSWPSPPSHPPKYSTAPSRTLLSNMSTTASVDSVTRQLSGMDINPKKALPSSTSSSKLGHSKQPSQQNVAKLLSKYAAPNPPNPSGLSSAASSNNVAQPSAAMAKLKATSSQPSLRNLTNAPNSKSTAAAGTTAKIREHPPAEGSTQPIDIGTYDGGLEREYARRGSTISGEAAQDLALDSSNAT